MTEKMAWEIGGWAVAILVLTLPTYWWAEHYRRRERRKCEEWRGHDADRWGYCQWCGTKLS